MTQVESALSSEEREAILSVKQAGGKVSSVLPEGHPVWHIYDQMTKEGEFQCLCRDHHVTAARQRRES